MAKLIIMRGLPASGKSTRAAEILKESGNAVRINKDLIRQMLHCGVWSGKKEGMTHEASHQLAALFLAKNKTVIIDDTNLNPTTLQGWKDFHPNHEVVDMDTSYEECVRRDVMRENRVGMPVIFKMARQYGLYPWNDLKEVICDIDGTIADIDHRRHFVRGEKKDWKSFFDAMWDDTPRSTIVDTLKRYKSAGRRIILVSGRPDDFAIVTQNWLSRWQIPYDGLIMRKSRDGRPDHEVKQDILNTYFRKNLIDLVIDDRPSVIRMWRSNGLEVMDVGTGEEF